MTAKRFILRARVTTENPSAVRPVLLQLLPGGSVTLTGDPKELVIKGERDGTNAGELNRELLSALRRVERRTRLRAEWSSEGTMERFFDFIPKSKRSVPPPPPSPP
ncbi:MAG: hypothetical protein L3J97_08075 [Thermoplasmata archaeon]|nr:hypothetical protein [Thermoplasmata archaeon]